MVITPLPSSRISLIIIASLVTCNLFSGAERIKTARRMSVLTPLYD